MGSAKLWIGGCILLVLLASGAYFALGPDDPAPQTSATVEGSESKPESNDNTSDRVVVGGVARPATDVRLSDNGKPERRQAPPVRQGFTPKLDPNTNPQVAGLFEDLTSRQRPSSFSSFAAAEPFDADAYARDPESYLARVEPSRVYAPAQPAPDVPVLKPAGNRLHRVRQGESVRLRVAAVPDAPVTFAAPRLGQFENQLSSITVRANDEGVAEAVFTASGGTIDEAPVLAASPMTSGQVSFTLLVSVN